MGEILRAVLESECVTSRPKFYAARMTIPLVPPPPPGVQSTVTTFNKTAWFLLTSFYVGATTIGVLGTQGWGLLNFGGQTMQLENVQTRKQFYLAPPLTGGVAGILVGSYNGSPVELPAYELFAPGERIKWTVTDFRIPFQAATSYFDICYAGIEYVMPKEAAAYGTP